MALTINHNLTAMRTSRLLGQAYGSLSKSMERVASGLRINSAADDAAGLAVREMMRTDILTGMQGIRNVADAISMIQTADGALSIIDEKLSRMKELAEQAATGIYTDVQRELINSEYQSMAAEIDRIANSTNFNGIKLLDGSVTNLHGGQGIKIHFGTTNRAAEDYYYVNVGDARATSFTGLKVGGDGKNDIWGQGAAAAVAGGPGCCAGGYSSLTGAAGFGDGEGFVYGYNWDWSQPDDSRLLTGRYIAGRYQADSGDGLQELVNRVNAGTQSRVGVQITADGLRDAVYAGGTIAVCFGDEAYVFGDQAAAGGIVDAAGNVSPVFSYTAAGTYDAGGFEYNAATGYGYGLTAAQIQRLEAAGLDLSPLGLEGLSVYAEGESNDGAEAARQSLAARLTEAVNAMGLRGLRSLSTDAGVTDGFTVSDATVLACADSTTVKGAGLQATIVSGRTLKVHTGVYADANGNWTDDRAVASALQLEEVVVSFENYGGLRSTATLVNGNTFVSEEYLVNGTGTLAITGPDAFELSNVGGVSLAVLGFASATVTGNFKGIGLTPASARADLQQQIASAWAREWSAVDNRLKFSAIPTITSAMLPKITSAAIRVQNDLDANPSPTLTAGRALAAGQSITVTFDVWSQSGTGTYTSSLAVATAMNAMGANFRRLELEFTANTAGTGYDFTVNGEAGVTFGTWTTGTIGTPLTLANIGDAINTNMASYLDGFTSQGRIWFAPENGPTSLFPPTVATISKSTVSKTATAVPDYLTVTAEVAGKTVRVDAGQAAALTRNTTTLGTLIAASGRALSRALSSVQQSAAAAGKTGMGRILTAAASPQNGNVDVSQVQILRESKTFVSGELIRSVAEGSYVFSGYSYDLGADIGLTSAQLRALTRAGVDLSRLHLAMAAVDASASSTVGSASARTALVDRLNQLWNDLDFTGLSSLTVNPGVKTGYAALTAADLIAEGVVQGVISGATPLSTIYGGNTLVVHTGVYADLNGNWTDDAAIASVLGLQEVTYSVGNDRVSWYRMAGNFRSSALVSGNLTVTSATADDIEAAGLTGFKTVFVNASVRVYSSARTPESASAILYTSGLAAWNSLYAGLDSLLFDGAAGNVLQIADFTASDVYASATANNVTARVPGGFVQAGCSLTFHTGIFASATGWFWTDDREMASAFGFAEIVYKVENNAAGNSYAITVTGPNGWLTALGNTPRDFQTLGTEFTNEVRSLMSYFQASGTRTGGRLYRGASPPAQAPSPAEFADTGARTRTRTDTGSPYLDIKFTVSGQTYSYLPYGPPALGSLSYDRTLADLTNDINTNLAAVIAGLQTGASVRGYAGAGRVVNALNSAPSAVITLADVTGLAEEDIYRQYSGEGTDGVVGRNLRVTMVASAGTASTDSQGRSNFGAWALASAINHNPDSQFWAMVQPFDSQGRAADMVYVFARDGGDLNALLADEAGAADVASRLGLDSVLFENVEARTITQSGTSFTLGGQQWATMTPVKSRAVLGAETWNVTLNGRDVGAERDLRIANQGEVRTPGLAAGLVNGMTRDAFVEIQNAADGVWAGAEIRTQSTAQEALEAIDAAIASKDRIRANLGSLMNRLENTMTNLTLQTESLQASESRISDVDVATEMTEFARSNVISQAAVSMLAQANSMASMALTLIRG